MFYNHLLIYIAKFTKYSETIENKLHTLI